jgi:transmembrane sensor
VSTTDWNRLGRYAAGELSPAESDEVRQWLTANPAEAHAFTALDAATRRMAASRTVDVEAALRRVKSRGVAPSRPHGVAIRMIAAAAMLVAVGLYASWSHQRGNAPLAYATAVGQTDTIAFGDSSTAVLGPGSRLEVRGREMVLAGTALFTIRDAAGGVIVRANDVSIRDIGTEFVVETTDDRVRVAVSSGVVEVSRKGMTVTADSGDVADVGADVGVRRDAFTPDDVAWTRGRLVLRNATMRDVASQLRRWYGIELRVAAALSSRHFTGTFEREPVARVAEVVAVAIGAVAEQRGDTIHLRPASASQ